MEVTLYSKSGTVHPYAPKLGRMEFYASTKEQCDFLNGLPPCREWLYYPKETASALLALGVHSVIHGHSGAVYTDGVAG